MSIYRFIRHSLFIFLLLFFSPLLAQSINDYIDVAIQQNPKIHAAKLAWQQSIELYPQATALSNPKLSLSYAIDPIETRLGPQKSSIQLNQALPFFGKLDLKGDQVKQDIALAKVSYEQTSQDVIADVKRSYYELLYLQHAIELTQQSQVILDKIAVMGLADYGNEVTGLNDVMKAQSQTAQMGYDLVLLQELHILEKSRFNSLLNRDINAPIAIQDVLIQPLVNLQNLSIERNDRLQIAALNSEKKRINHQLARYTYLPDINVGFKYVQIEDTGFGGQEAGRDGLSVMLSVSVPLWQAKNSATIRQAHLQQAQSQATQADIHNTLQYQLQKSYFKLSNAERLIKLYGDALLPQAQQAMDVAQLNYQTTQNGLAQFLESESTRLNFQLAYHRANTDYLRYRVDLERLIGNDLTGVKANAQ